MKTAYREESQMVIRQVNSYKGGNEITCYAASIAALTQIYAERKKKV